MPLPRWMGPCSPYASQPCRTLPYVAVLAGDQLLPYVWDGKRISAMDEKALQDDDVNKGASMCAGLCAGLLDCCVCRGVYVRQGRVT